MTPIDPYCDCPVCRRYSKAYIRHLLKAEEMLSQRLLVMHNLWFYNHLMEDIRNALDNGNFAEFKREKEIIYAKRMWGTEELYSFNNYGWFQFSSVQAATKETPNLEQALNRMFSTNNNWF